MKRAAIILALLTGCVTPQEAEKTTVFTRAAAKWAIAAVPSWDNPKCLVTRVVDGDTLKMTCGRTLASARLMGFDTPETYRPKCPEEYALGKRASKYLQYRLRTAKVIGPKSHGLDKYKRALVSLTLDGVPLEKIMVQQGLAVPYSGGKRIDWCARLKE